MGRLHQDVLWRQAQRAYAAHQLDQARHLCEQLLASNRNSANAVLMLGQVAVAEQRFDDAAAYALRAADLKPKEPQAFLLLGEVRASQGRFADAIAEFDKVLRWDHEHARAIAGKANAYEQSGRRDQARAVLKPLVESGRETAQQAVIQARLDLHDRDYDAVLDVIDRHLERGDAKGFLLWHLHHHRGQALERTQRFDEAFAAYEQANRSVPARFDAESCVQTIDGIIQSFTPQRFAGLPRAAHGVDVPIFIVGMPRCGSTLLETILSAHPDVAAAGEYTVMQEIINSIALDIGSNLPYPACIEDLEQSDVDIAAGRYLDRLRGVNGQAIRIVDKFLNNYRHVGMLAVLFPAARIVHCHRHPLDTCFSCFQTPLAPATHPYASDLGHLGATYVAYERLMAHWRDALKIPMLEVPYESVVADQEGMTRRLLEFCGLDWDDRCLRFYERGRVVLTASYDQVNRPIYASSVGRYRNFEKHLGPLKQALAEGGWTEEAFARAATPG